MSEIVNDPLYLLVDANGDRVLVKDNASVYAAIQVLIESQSPVNILTTKGDILSFSTQKVRLGVGSNGQVLTADSLEPTGVKWAAATSSNPITTKGDLIIGDANGLSQRLPVGANGNVLTANSALPNGVQWSSAPSNSAAIYLHSEMTATANSTIGQFCKSSDIGAVTNPSGKALTSPFDVGLNNAGTIGYLVPESNLDIVAFKLKFAGASVPTGTVGTPTVRIRVFRQNYSTRTQLGVDIDIPISSVGIGIFNNASADAFQYVNHNVSIAVSEGDLIGWEFVNQAGNDGISAIRNVTLTAKLS